MWEMVEFIRFLLEVDLSRSLGYFTEKCGTVTKYVTDVTQIVEDCHKSWNKEKGRGFKEGGGCTTIAAWRCKVSLIKVHM